MEGGQERSRDGVTDSHTHTHTHSVAYVDADG